MLLCAQPTRKTIANYDWVPIPPLPELIALHERILEPLRPSKVIGVALNTFDLDDAAARAEIAKTARETGLPCTDSVRYDPAPLVDAILDVHTARRKA
jgi:uncharacterized NAD-dependent epimerase/dehydratase family protein